MSRLVRDLALVHHFNVAPLGIRSPQAFLADEVGLVIYHETIGRAALAKIPRFLESG